MTLIEVIFATAVVEVALVGIVSAILASSTNRQAAADINHAVKACEEMMDMLSSMPFDTMMLQNGVPFTAKKLSPTVNVGSVTAIYIQSSGNVGEPMPGSQISDLAEVTVQINSATTTIRPVQVTLVRWRSRQP